MGANWLSSTNGHIYFKTILLTNNKGCGALEDQPLSGIRFIASHSTYPNSSVNYFPPLGFPAAVVFY